MLSFFNLTSTEIVMIVLWAIVTIFAIIIEFETINLVSIWFAAGGYSWYYYCGNTSTYLVTNITFCNCYCSICRFNKTVCKENER